VFEYKARALPALPSSQHDWLSLDGTFLIYLTSCVALFFFLFFFIIWYCLFSAKQCNEILELEYNTCYFMHNGY